MIVGDPLFRSWAAAQAPALGVSLPLACAIFVLAQGRFARQRVRAQSLAEALNAGAARPDAKQVAKSFGGDSALKDKLLSDTLKVMDEDLPVASGSARASVVSPPEADAPPEARDDRWMVLGLVALFAVFGLFLTVTMLIPE
jgi:hypothetical protein